MKVLGGLVAGVLALGLGGAAEADVLVKVDKSAQRMTVEVDGKVAHVWAVSTARSGYSTPSGTYRPLRLHRMWYSQKYDLSPMPHAIFFSGGYAIHGTSAVRQLGRPASHGCVRLAPGHAAQLYALVQAHGMSATRIRLYGSPRQSEPQLASRNRLRTGSRVARATTAQEAGYQLASAQIGAAYGTRPYGQVRYAQPAFGHGRHGGGTYLLRVR
jgi:hypothetical protein